MTTAPTTAQLEPTQFDNIRPTLSRRQLRFILIGIAALVLIPILYVMGRREIARWYQASIKDAIYQGDYASAVENGEKALSWDPTNLEIFSLTSQSLMAMTQAKEAAAVADQALIVARINYEGRPSPANLTQLASALNQSAYAHALDGTRLEHSLELIDEALGYFPNRIVGAFLDTRGYLHYLLGNDEKALQDMELAVTVEEQSYREIQTSRRVESRMFIDQSRIAYERKSAKEAMAVLYHHRGLVYERIGEAEKAKKDLERAKRMGYAPDKGVW